jgi:Sulfotransferase family
MSDAPLVFVVGLQKSGTTLLLKLLTSTSAFRNPVRFEGKELWGDEPPFAPIAFPAGHVYQRDGGNSGHEIGAADATPEVLAHLRERLGNAGSATKGLVLKNPYNTVRLPWIRALFPQAYIVAVVRRPLPNTFSLLKKHTPNPHLRQGAEEGWWGVKPAGWRDLVQDDKLLQSAWQWQRVNAKLLAERDLIDRFVPYHELGADPAGVGTEIARATVKAVPKMKFPPITVLDSEYLDGGRLQSSNVIVRRTKSLDLAGDQRDSGELAPLTPEQQDAVMKICGETAEALGLGAKASVT